MSTENTATDNRTVELSLRDIFRSIFRHIVLVVIIPVLAVGVTAYVSWNVLPKTYTAETTMYVLTQSNADTLNYTELNLSTQLVSDYQELVNSKRVKAGAAEMLGLDAKEMEKQYKIGVDSTTSTRLIRLSVTGQSPAMAANIANALADQLSECILEVTNVENISVIDEATPPDTASGPQSLRNTAIAGVGGLVISVMLAIVIDMTNISIRTREDVEKILGQHVLAQIPLDNGKRK